MKELSLEGAKKRLAGIVEGHARRLSEKMEREGTKVLAFNEALLEEWTEILERMLFLRDPKPTRAKAVTAVKHQPPLLRHFPAPLPHSSPLAQRSSTPSCILATDANHCQLFQAAQVAGKITISPSKLSFPKGFLRKYSSYNLIEEGRVILIGGSRESNPNLKSKEILALNIAEGQVEKVGETPYGISSHASIRIGHHIYAIGGNKDMNTVTKACFRFNYQTREIKTIAALNYPSASHAALAWKETFIYKFGGVGSCFGAWDLSPYIERYSLAQDEWEVINPTLRIDEGLFDHYSLLANSLAVPCSDGIMIFGGFDFDFTPSNKMMRMTVAGDHHEITTIGTVEGMQAGGFFQQEPIYLSGGAVAVQAVQHSQGLQLKPIALSTHAHYP